MASFNFKPQGKQKLQEEKKLNRKPRGRRREDERQRIAVLNDRIIAGAPAPGSNPLASVIPNDNLLEQQQQQDSASMTSVSYVGAKLFQHLPISDATLRGLADAMYVRMTAIQRAAIPHALCGRDVLGAAKTGSGKTLAFLIPVVEKLYRLLWCSIDGVGAVIISPTRELAVQIFDELKKVGKYHDLSGGLLIGGRKGVDMEKDRVNNLNILVCTPGRLLQHMDETPNFDCSQLQVLVLDEADRILDMGFAGTVNAIIAQLPNTRQTLLFSATQTRSVQDLARLSLKDPEYLSVHAESTVATPSRLHQTALIVPSEEKLDMLWSFVKMHLHAKILVFLSSCKQVKFVHEAFRRLRPGISIKCLHGRMKQAQRMIVFFKFCEEKHSLLFATDVASRGLDFPAVDWVVQVDCPEDVPSYIHRVGRTARYTSTGHSLLFLCPSEKKMLSVLQAAKIPVKLIKANANKLQRVSGALAGLLSKDPDLKYMAQRAFVTYLRSVHLRPDKEIFDIMKLPVEEYALSLGLPTTPRIRFLRIGASGHQGMDNAKGINQLTIQSGGSGKEGFTAVAGDGIHYTTQQGAAEIGDLKLEKKRSKLDRLFNRKNANVLSSAFERMRSTNETEQVNDIQDGDGFLTRKRMRLYSEGEDDHKSILIDSLPTRLTKKKKLKINPNRPAGQRLVFDEVGNAVPPLAAFAKSKALEYISDGKTGSDDDVELATKERYKKLEEEMKKRDREDRLLEKQRLHEKRLKWKGKRKEERECDELASSGYSEPDKDKTVKVLPKKTYFNSSSSDEGGNENSGDSGTEDKQQILGNRGRISIEKSEKLPPKMKALSLADQESLALSILKSRG
eukprot:c26981_g1_i2 orf=166-2706(+)